MRGRTLSPGVMNWCVMKPWICTLLGQNVLIPWAHTAPKGLEPPWSWAFHMHSPELLLPGLPLPHLSEGEAVWFQTPPDLETLLLGVQMERFLCPGVTWAVRGWATHLNVFVARLLWASQSQDKDFLCLVPKHKHLGKPQSCTLHVGFSQCVPALALVTS